MAGYTRNDTGNNIADGNVINAADLDGEFDSIQTAFNETSGHTHDGTADEGAPISVVGPAQDINVTITEVVPKTTNTMSLGTGALQFKDLYIDGTANIDSLVADTADINAGTIDGTTIGASTPAAITGTSITATGNIAVTGTVDGRDVATDGTKLDTIETNADVTDTANVTAAGALMDSELTNITAVKDLDQGVATTDSPSFAGLTATTADINGGTIDGATIATSDITVGAGKTLDVSAGTLTLANDQISGDKVQGGTIGSTTITTLTGTTANVTDVNATTVDTTNIEVTNIKAKDGTAAATIADATGVVTIPSAVLTTADINGGTIDNATIATSDVTVGAGKTLDVSAGTLTLANDQISGNKIQGGTIGSTTITTLTGTTGNITNVNATTVDATNIEVTNIKAKDGTAAATIANTTGVVTIPSAVLTTADINGGTIDNATIATSDVTVGAGKTLDVSAGTLTLANDQISGDKIQGGTIGSTTITTLTGTTGNITNVNATTVDTTNIEVTNIKAKDGTASATIADATGVMTIASSVLTTTDINGGTIDGATIATSDVTVGAGKTLDVSAGTLTLADDQISGDKIQGGTIGSTTITTLTGTTGNITNVNATTVDTTNIEVTNIKAKDGTASATIADSTGVMTVASSVLTTTDINGGTIDGVTIGGASAGAGTFTSVTGTSLDMNGLADFGGNIALSRADNTILYRTDDTGVVDIRSATASLSGSNIQLYAGSHASFPNYSIVFGDTMLFRPVDGSPEFMRFVDGTGAVFNEGGADLDFRIESDTISHAFFLQGSDGKIGIGTNTPAEKLEVTGNIILDAADATIKIKSGTAGTAGAVNFTFNTDSTVYGSLSLPYDTRTSVGLLVKSNNSYPMSIASGTSSSATNAVILSTSGEEAMRVNYLGRVGIGDSAPPTILSVRGDTPESRITNTNLISDTGGTEEVARLGVYGQNNSVYGPAANIVFRQDASTWSSVEQYQKGTRIEFCTQDNTATDTSETPRMVIDLDGNVGIGTSSPTNGKLEVVNDDPTQASLYVNSPTGGWGLEIAAHSLASETDLVLNSNATIASGLSLNMITAGDNNFRWYSGATSNKTGTSGATNIATLLSSGEFELKTGGISIETSGQGITFAGRTSVLDDYEEGTWTPTYTGQSGQPDSISYDLQEAHYTKIGSVVTIVGKIQTSGITGNFSGGIRLSGLPFAAIPASTDAAGGMVVANCVNFLDDFPCSGYLRPNTIHITLRTRTDFKSQMRDMVNADMLKVGSGNLLSFSATYITEE
jgi:hypothetical protein